MGCTILVFYAKEFKNYFSNIHVLVSSEKELIYFKVAGMVQYFRFRRKIMLITHRCFSCYCAVLTLSQGLFCFSARRLGVCEKLGGTQPEELTKMHQRDIPYYMMLCSAIKLREWGRGASIAQELAGHWSAGGEQ